MTVLANQIGFQSSEGFITMNATGSVLNFAFTTSYQEMSSIGTNFILASPTQNFEMTTDGRLKYIGIKPYTFMFDAFFQLAAGGGINTAIQLYKNGSPVAGSDSYAGLSSTNIIKFPVSMVTNDYVSLWVKRSSASSPRVMQIILSAASVNGV